LLRVFASAESDPDLDDSDDYGLYDSEDDDIMDIMFGGGGFARMDERIRRLAERRQQRQQARNEAAAREVKELGPPMAVLVPKGMSMSGGPAADKALREVSLL
jgi:hypothetical protein